MYAVDSNLIRPADNAIIVGDNQKIKNQTQWRQQFTIGQSIHDILQNWIFQLRRVDIEGHI
jgi:GDP-D-mannose dehydratase